MASASDDTDPPPSDGSVGRLRPADLAVLAHWLSAARNRGIDRADDLTARPWRVAQAETVIGLFRTGQLLASWLVIRSGGQWAVASCADRVVTGPFASLADALGSLPLDDPIAAPPVVPAPADGADHPAEQD